MIPEKFKERMKTLLGDRYPLFISALENAANERGLRINTVKTTAESFLAASSFPLTKLSYSTDGYLLESDEPMGNTPEHHAGMIYMQDPGAMATLAALDIPRAATVLDLCAAPGGKTGQAAAMIGEDGFILANEYVPKRAKILVGNLERLGIKNAAVSSLDTSEFPKLFDSFFDVVIADVPCSGEGMFRKSDEARREWSEENVIACAKRQREILENAHTLVKTGGFIVYSTCTWSLEENEMNVLHFLKNHSDFELYKASAALKEVTSDGINYLGTEEGELLKECRRFYPHVSKGEGQFVAILRKNASDTPPRVNYKDRSTAPTKSEKAIIEEFFKQNLVAMPKERVYKIADKLVLAPNGAPPPVPNSLFMYGVLIGEIRKGILTPSHQFFSAFGKDFKRKLDLKREDERLKRYLAGEEIENDGLSKGYAVILYGGAPIGGAKAVGDKLKNHYPKGLRTK